MLIITKNGDYQLGSIYELHIMANTEKNQGS